MATTVITGGTDGIGRALADTYLGRGHEVLIIGASAQKGEAFLQSAAGRGAADRARFVQADLSLVAENDRVIDLITRTYPQIDVLVLGARYHRSTRVETPDGFESNFALYYLSRFLFSHGLVEPLARAERATVLNFGGSGLMGPVRFDDLQLRRGYPGAGAMAHAGALCDLLGVQFVKLHADTNIHYVIDLPGVVSTSFAGEYDAPSAAAVARLKLTGKPVSRAVDEILPFLDAPPARLTAVVEGQRAGTDTRGFDPDAAARLHDITEKLLSNVQR
jgi:NAD(P)-dependent dehydrogenase (short-subunit alcohol dehydrogenase family)